MKVVILSTATSYTGGAIITLLNVLPLLQKEGVEPYFILKGHGQLEDVLRNRKIPYSVIKSYDWCVPEQKTKGLKNVVAWKIKSLINLIAEYKTYFLLKREKAELYHMFLRKTAAVRRHYASLQLPLFEKSMFENTENFIIDLKRAAGTAYCF